jgi:phosphoribosylaminoimidazolecarboxamide formyltransferase/IMP cyclohydrolase
MSIPNEHPPDRGLVGIRRALVSVSDKNGLTELAAGLQDLGIEILSTGGTARVLRGAGVRALDVGEITGFPEMLEGRVKTLHPKIHAGILAKRSDPTHLRQLQEHGIGPIDLVIVTLYPFEATIAKTHVSLEEAIEQIDIGGPSLIRAAAKNFEHVAVVVDPEDYAGLLTDLRQNRGRLSRDLRLRLARKAFAHVARYDALIANYLQRSIDEGHEPPLPDLLDLLLFKAQRLRYGENPHQRAALYRAPEVDGPSVASAKQLQGKELSFNNLLDLDAALALAREFEEPVAVIVKHTNPCGVGRGSRLIDAYLHARAADPASAYGGVLGINRAVDAETARELSATFMEAIIAPGYEEAALGMLRDKKALRLLLTELWSGATRPVRPHRELRSIAGAMLVQERDSIDLNLNDLHTVTRRSPSAGEMRALRFAWLVAKHVKSNAIVLANEHATVGIGAGQMSRVDACRLAVTKAVSPTQGAVLASDAFFPFRDGVDTAAEAGITAIIQPGGSVRDAEVIVAADEAGIAMVFTGIRHFRH